MPNGRLPGPPDDDSGPTLPHAHDIVFGVPPPYGSPVYQSDLPTLGSTRTDQAFRNAPAFIKGRWSLRVREPQVQMQSRRGR